MPPKTNHLFFKLFSPEKTVCRLKTLVFFRSGPFEGPKPSYLSSQKLLRLNIPNFESKHRFLLLSASSSIVHRQWYQFPWCGWKVLEALDGQGGKTLFNLEPRTKIIQSKISSTYPGRYPRTFHQQLMFRFISFELWAFWGGGGQGIFPGALWAKSLIQEIQLHTLKRVELAGFPSIYK